MMYVYGIAGVIAGGFLGYAYWRFVGCRSGMCLITQNKYISTIYGALVGGLLTVQLNMV